MRVGKSLKSMASMTSAFENMEGITDIILLFKMLTVYHSVNVWRYCTEIFDYLALAALIEDKIFW